MSKTFVLALEQKVLGIIKENLKTLGPTPNKQQFHSAFNEPIKEAFANIRSHISLSNDEKNKILVFYINDSHSNFIQIS